MSEILLSKSAYTHNLTQIANKIGSKDKIIAVLKDNAYGHGALLMGKIASEFGIKIACVKSELEARELSELFDNIIVLSHLPNGNESGEFIYAINELRALEIIKPKTQIHLAIDTLMHRNGINIDEIEEAIDIIKKRNLILKGAFTHFRASDEHGGDYFVQKDNFNTAKTKIKKLFKGELIFHSHNSAAIERSADIGDEYVRAGMAQFGYFGFNDSLGLKRVLSLYADRISSRVLRTGQSVGYGGAFTAKEDMNIATYDLGYGDGLLRYNGKGELYLANGKPILGKMSMDSFSSIDMGERICVFDNADIWAEFFGTINYDILVKLSPTIARRVVE
ncbi:alanine racemase [Campylobacter lanienae]|uniref:alanine racemase n=1 Tax=Campylobacter lanienae TaxID=75658 RepID=UPI0011AC83A9|nr:alanine racemase [Campylobacter lanienae]TWO13257.1 alanine racemase [Campylobacter lanienae]